MQQSADQPGAPTFSTRPSPVVVLAYAPGWKLLLLAGAAIILAAVLLPLGWKSWVVIAGVVLLGLRVVWALFSLCICREYTVTQGVLTLREGVITRVQRELNLANVQHAVVRQTAFERLVGAGTISLASAGTSGYAATLWAVPRAQRVLKMLTADAKEPRRSGRIVVVGLVGGIASGKSAVARILEREGFTVLDADKDAKAALDRDDVRAQLVSWWGEGILSERRVDRARVADIVFQDPAQRRRLEELVHPIVRADRARAIEAATRAGKAGVVIDAPLLFEAGSDKECDRVLFVDAPLEQRVARAIATRGWTREELERREAAQLPTDQKRARSSDVVINDADLATLEKRVRALASGWRLSADNR